jgi:N4-gp56 family major capsid protein
MADAFTTTASLPYDQAAYDQMAYWALRPQLYYNSVADVRSTNQSMNGSSVIFSQQNDLAAATSTLSESVDVDAVALSATQVTVSLAEYGNAVNTTALVRGTSYVVIDNLVANAVGFNAGISMDTVIRNVLQAGTNVLYASTAVSRVTVGAAMTITAARVRQVRAQLVGANVMPNAGNLFTAYIHPDVAYDLRGETGSAAWRDPHTYSQPDEIWTGEVGQFEGFRFIETPRAPFFPDTGVGGTVDVYGTLFLGQQALAKAWSRADGNSEDPQVVLGPVTDHLRRFQPVGWYGLEGFGRFREASIRRLESSSSIGVNT